MARRRTAAEQVGVPELDEQEDREREELEARLAAEQKEAAAAAAPPEEEPPAVPDWVPEKFKKDPTQFVESYGRLEDELRQRSEREKALELQLAELQQQAERVHAADDRDLIYGIPRDRVEAAYEEDPVGTQAWLAEQAAGAVAQRAFSRAPEPPDHMQNAMIARTVNETMAAEFDDWEEVAGEVRNRLAADPLLLPDKVFESDDPLGGVKRHLSMIYKDVKYDKLIEEQKDLRERGIQQQDVNTARKREAQTLSGASGRAPEPSEAEKELAEMRAALSGSSYSLHRAQEKRP